MTDVARLDASTRRRLDADFDSTLFVEAGAGTGKTTAVTRRVVELVAAGRLRAERLVAITFTEAAAAELRARVREALEAASTDPDHDEAARERCRIAGGGDRPCLDRHDPRVRRRAPPDVSARGWPAARVPGAR